MRQEWNDDRIERELHALHGNMDTRFGKVEGRLDGIDTRLDGIDARFDRMDQRLDKIDARLDRFDERFENLTERIDARLHAMHRTMFQAMTVFLAGLLGILAAQLA